MCHYISGNLNQPINQTNTYKLSKEWFYLGDISRIVTWTRT